MCKSIADGGQRCHSHAKARLDAARAELDRLISQQRYPRGEQADKITRARERLAECEIDYVTTTQGMSEYTALRDIADQTARNTEDVPTMMARMEEAARLDLIVRRAEWRRDAMLETALRCNGAATTINLDQPSAASWLQNWYGNGVYQDGMTDEDAAEKVKRLLARLPKEQRTAAIRGWGLDGQPPATTQHADAWPDALKAMAAMRDQDRERLTNPDPYRHMQAFTPDANKALHENTEAVVARIATMDRVTYDDIERLRDEVTATTAASLKKAGITGPHGIHDSEPRAAVWERLEQAASERGVYVPQ
jgi:hypothetical protein